MDNWSAFGILPYPASSDIQLPIKGGGNILLPSGKQKPPAKPGVFVCEPLKAA
jgi:hypothetical protein